jgi:hypothetical protein
LDFFTAHRSKRTSRIWPLFADTGYIEDKNVAIEYPEPFKHK